MTVTSSLVAAAALRFSVAAGLVFANKPAVADPPAADPGAPPPGAASTRKPLAPSPASAKPAPGPALAEPPEPAPALPKVRFTTRRGQILPEGTFLVSRRGELVHDSRAGWGGWTFRFDPDAKGASEAPMILMPCSRLEAMQRLAQTRSSGVEYTVSGQVFVYAGRNYLLPIYDEARAPAPTPTPTEPPPDTADAEPATPALTPGSAEEEVQRRLRALDSVTRDRPRISAPPPAPAADTTPDPSDSVGAPRTPPTRGGLVAEGTYLASRRGRLVRESAGEWVFRFDADARGQVDPPMLLLPCMNLQAMQGIAAARGDAVTFTVSGQVYVFENENYFLPALYRVDSTNPDLLPPR